MPPKTPSRDIRLHNPPSRTSPGPKTSRHPPSPWLGSQYWSQCTQTLQGRICKRHIHIANHIGVRLLVKGFVSDPSPRGTDRERAQSRQAGRGLEREKQRGG